VFRGRDAEIPAEDAIARDAHLIGHQDGLKLSRTAWDEVLFQVLWSGGTAASARAACARLGLTSVLGLQVRKLSAGQRRRLALARLAASPRSLWLLDEPLAPLDRDQRGVVGELMAEHLAGGGLILAAAHDPLPAAAGPSWRSASTSPWPACCRWRSAPIPRGWLAWPPVLPGWSWRWPRCCRWSGCSSATSRMGRST
jgi:ABC-type transport system involved in cytochrome c biogenesis ATPase subunit